MPNLKNIDSEKLFRFYTACVAQRAAGYTPSYFGVSLEEYRDELLARLKLYDHECTKHLK